MTTRTRAPFTVNSAAVPTKEEIATFRKLTREEQQAFLDAELEKGWSAGPSSRSLEDIWRSVLTGVEQERTNRQKT